MCQSVIITLGHGCVVLEAIRVPQNKGTSPQLYSELWTCLAFAWPCGLLCFQIGWLLACLLYHIFGLLLWLAVVVVMACGSASRLPVLELRGYELTEDYLIENGFRRPIIVRCKDGLDLQVPPEDFSIQDVEDHVGMFGLFCCLYSVVDNVLSWCISLG